MRACAHTHFLKMIKPVLQLCSSFVVAERVIITIIGIFHYTDQLQFHFFHIYKTRPRVCATVATTTSAFLHNVLVNVLSFRACFLQLKNMCLENYKSFEYFLCTEYNPICARSSVTVHSPFHSQFSYWMAVAFTHWASEHHQNCTEVFVTLLTFHDSERLCIVAESSFMRLGCIGRYYWNLHGNNIKEKVQEIKKWMSAWSSTNLYSGFHHQTFQWCRSEPCNLSICHLKIRLLFFIPDTLHPCRLDTIWWTFKDDS